MNDQALAVTLQAVRDKGKATANDVSEMIGLSQNATRKRLLWMFREEMLDRETLEGHLQGGGEYIYWSVNDEPFVAPVIPSTKELIFSAVLEADRLITAQEIARRVGFGVSLAQVWLKVLYEGGKLHRERSGRSYLYESSDGKPATEIEEGEVFMNDVDRAIAKSRPHWRIGELFTREEKERYREEQHRLRYYVRRGYS